MDKGNPSIDFAKEADSVGACCAESEMETGAMAKMKHNNPQAMIGSLRK